MLFVRTFLFLGCALILAAQTEPAQAGSGEAEAPPAAAGDYSGPAILSRGENPVPQTVAPVAFRPYIGLNGIYDTGLLAVGVTSNGQIPTTDVYGMELTLGAYTYRTWKRTTLALDYRGNFRHYSNTTWDGTDQFLSLIVSHKPSKRVALNFRNTAGLYSQNYLLSGSPLGALDPNYLNIPQNDIYDNRVIFLSTDAYITYRTSARLSFSFGGGGNLVRRQSSALYGVSGAVAHADMQYRVSRHSTLGVDYRFTYFDYTRGFGNSNINSVGVNYSTQFTPHVQLSARIGGALVKSNSLEVVTLDPSVAALLGETVGIQAAYRQNYVPDIEVRLTDSYRRSQFNLSYVDAVIPGNGVYLTSKSDTGAAGYSYSGIRYWNFGADASYGRMTALVQTIGAYTSYGAGVGVTRELGKGLHAVLRLDARHYDLATGLQLSHTEYRASVGIAFSPGDLPLSLW